MLYLITWQTKNRVKFHTTIFLWTRAKSAGATNNPQVTSTTTPQTGFTLPAGPHQRSSVPPPSTIPTTGLVRLAAVLVSMKTSTVFTEVIMRESFLKVLFRTLGGSRNTKKVLLCINVVFFKNRYLNQSYSTSYYITYISLIDAEYFFII